MTTSSRMVLVLEVDLGACLEGIYDKRTVFAVMLEG